MMHYVTEHVKPPMKFRLKSTELSHFKLLVLFVFTVYGILIPLWFAFHGNKLLGNDDQWRKVVRSSTRIAWSQIKHFDNKKKKSHSGSLVSNTTRYIKSAVKRLSRKHKATGPKPLYRHQFWPKVPLPPQKITYRPGRLLSMEWEHLCCQSINCLRKFPLFPLWPNKKTFLKRLKLSKQGALYGQRIAGLLKPPESGSYSIYMKCLSTCEFWLSDNEYPLRSKLLKKIVRGIPVEHDSNVNGSFSRSLVFKATLQTGRAYFMDVLLTVYKYIKHPFEVLWKLPRSDRFVPLSNKFFTGFNKNPESLKNVLRLYSHSPSVHLSPFLESIEEPGDDDDDFTILGGKNHNVNEAFMDYQGHPIYANSTLQYGNLLSFPSVKSLPIFKECVHMPLFLKNKNLKKYAGVWKTTFSSVFPRDNTDHMMCIGNRYPKDCQGNEVVSRQTVSRALTLYSKALSDSSIRSLAADDHVLKKDFKNSDIKIHHLVNVVEKIDSRNGSLLLVDAIAKHPRTNSTYLVSQYLYMDKNRSSLCLAKGYTINLDVTVNVVIVAKQQNNWLLHFLANMGKIFVKTNDKNMNVIIAKYGNDNVELMEEYQRNRLPSIRTVRHRGAFDKRRAIQSAVEKIKDQNSIVFLMDLHIVVPDNIIQLVRKYTIQGHLVFNPVLFRLSHCGSPASSRRPPRGFWETFGYGILGIYKSDWDNLGSMTTKKYKKGWGGEDWELLDRIFAAGLAVQRIRVPNFYHFYHSKKGMWN